MDSCAYVRENGITCRSRYNLKEVEFRHPDYKQLSKSIVLCETHFQIVFEDIINEERKAYREYERRSKRYQELFNEAREAITKNEGYFIREDFKILNYGKVSRAKAEWMTIRKGRCRLEYCKQEIKSMRKHYVIRVFPKNPNDYINYLFCSNKHWEAIKLRIGLTKTKIIRPASNLENYL